MRAEKRRLEKEEKKKEKRVMVSRRELEVLVNKELSVAKQNIIHMTSIAVSSCFIVSLHEEYGFGAKRLERLLAKVRYNFEEIGEGKISLDDLIDKCEKFGVVVK